MKLINSLESFAFPKLKEKGMQTSSNQIHIFFRQSVWTPWKDVLVLPKSREGPTQSSPPGINFLLSGSSWVLGVWLHPQTPFNSPNCCRAVKALEGWNKRQLELDDFHIQLWRCWSRQLPSASYWGFLGFKCSLIARYTIRGGLEEVVIGYFLSNLLSVVNINYRSSSSL